MHMVCRPLCFQPEPDCIAQWWNLQLLGSASHRHIVACNGGKVEQNCIMCCRRNYSPLPLLKGLCVGLSSRQFSPTSCQRCAADPTPAQGSEPATPSCCTCCLRHNCPGRLARMLIRQTRNLLNYFRQTIDVLQNCVATLSLAWLPVFAAIQ